jgi:hypothetical protein
MIRRRCGPGRNAIRGAGSGRFAAVGHDLGRTPGGTCGSGRARCRSPPIGGGEHLWVDTRSGGRGGWWRHGCLLTRGVEGALSAMARWSSVADLVRSVAAPLDPDTRLPHQDPDRASGLSTRPGRTLHCVPLVTPMHVRNAGHASPRHKGDIGSTTGTDMHFRARAGRLAGGLVVATALLGALPGQALATSPTPAPAPPTAPVTTAPAESAPLPAAPTARPVPATESRQPQVRQVPAGAPDTGGGSAADDPGVPDGALLALGALAAAGTAGALVSRRRRAVPQD